MLVQRDGAPVRVSGVRPRTVLAALALAAGRPVTVDALIEIGWGPRHGSGVRSTLQTTVGRLRRNLGDGLVVTASDGYALRIDADQVDVHRFKALLATPDPDLARLNQALALWRGEPLQDIASETLQQGYVPGLTEDWFAAVQRRTDLLLAQGRHAELVPELRDLTARHPLREPLWRQLMLALYRTGQQSDALDAYERLRVELRDQLGLDPSPELRQLHQAVLAQDPELRAPQPTAAMDVAPPVAVHDGQGVAVLGRSQRDNGAIPQARESWREALALLEEQQSPDAEPLRDELTALNDSGQSGGG